MIIRFTDTDGTTHEMEGVGSFTVDPDGTDYVRVYFKDLVDEEDGTLGRSYHAYDFEVIVE